MPAMGQYLYQTHKSFNMSGGRASTNKIIVIPLKLQTAAEFTALNPILLRGQEGYETDTRKRKVGDGVTAWNDLQYDAAGTTSGAATLPAAPQWFYM